MENVVILGSGNAGLTAALYAARADLKPLVVSGRDEGGQLMLTTTVENYPGFPEGIQGPELIDNMKKQAEKFGARFKDGDAAGFEIKEGHFEISLKDEKLKTKTLIIATGASARMLGLESEKRYVGKGVATCATCDAYFFKDKEVFVIGGGDSACEEALTLSKFANKVTIVHRRDELKASKIMQKRVMDNKKIDILWNTVLEEVLGDEKKVTGAKLKNVKNNKVEEKKIDGIFLAIGHVPNTKMFKGKIEMDEIGFIKTDKRRRTNIDGVYAAGDVQDPIFKQAVTSAGAGCEAAMEAEKFIEGMEEKRG